MRRLNREGAMAVNKAIKEKFDAVQVLRALAAALVVFQHAVMNWAEKAIAPGPMPSLPAMGDYGVKLFFCISGVEIVRWREKAHRPLSPG